LGALEVLSLEVKTSIIQGIVVFLSLFETDPGVRRIFCPPKELYEGKPCPSDPCLNKLFAQFDFAPEAV